MSFGFSAKQRIAIFRIGTFLYIIIVKRNSRLKQLKHLIEKSDIYDPEYRSRLVFSDAATLLLLQRPREFFFIDFGIFHFSVFLQHVLARVPDDLQTSVVNPMLSSHATDIHNHTRFVLYFYST